MISKLSKRKTKIFIIYFTILKPFKNWYVVGTQGYRSPGLIQKKTYNDADIFGLLISVYLIVEGDFIFDGDNDVIKDFEVPRINSSLKFQGFITEMLSDIFSGTFTHKKMMNHRWIRG